MPRENSRPILVLSPHPDDETFGCGGTIKLLTNAGTPVDVAFMTRGELGTETPEAINTHERKALAEVRSHEAIAACQILGVRRSYFLSGIDGQLKECPIVAEQIAELLRQDDYGRVMCPGVNEAHPDHQATYRWLCHALQMTQRQVDIWSYEVWTPLHPNIYVPIDETMPAKISAAEAHASQLECLDFRSGFSGLAAYRALACPPCKFAEAFYVMNSKQLIASN